MEWADTLKESLKEKPLAQATKDFSLIIIIIIVPFFC